MKKFKLSNLIFISVISLVLVIGFVRTLIGPVDINEYENRTAEKLSKLTLESYSSGDFQDSVELAAGDQIPFAIELKRIYNRSFSKFTTGILNKMIARESEKQEAKKDTEDENTSETVTTGPALETGSAVTTEPAVTTGSAADEKNDDEEKQAEVDPQKDIQNSQEQYVRVGNYWMYKGHLMYGQNWLESIQDAIDLHANNISKQAAKYPDINFYVFYLEKETDMKFITGERTEVGSYLLSKINIPEDHKSIYKVEDWETFDSEFYKTDHHWNYKGSYRAYTTLLKTLLPYATPLEPVEEVYLGKSAGSRTDTDATASYVEDFYVYTFNYPDMLYYYGSNLQVDYGGNNDGGQDAMVAKAKSGNTYKQVSYGSYYGGDWKELIIDNLEDTGNGSILVLGTSYDNAVVKPLATHYDKLYCLDLRSWPAEEGSDRYNGFSLEDYLAEHPDINNVLFFGDVAYYKGATFYIYE